jgi:hypothetical protein
MQLLSILLHTTIGPLSLKNANSGLVVRCHAKTIFYILIPYFTIKVFFCGPTPFKVRLFQVLGSTDLI